MPKQPSIHGFVQGWKEDSKQIGKERKVCTIPLLKKIAVAAESYPSQVALRSVDLDVDYKSLMVTSDWLSHKLIQQFKSDASIPLIAIVGSRSADLVVSILSVLKAGMAFVVLDTMFPSKRLEAFIAKSCPSGFIVLGERDVSFAPVSEGVEGNVVRFNLSELLSSLDEIEQEIEGCKLPAREQIQEQSLAYLLFTSGSEGAPKAVANSLGPLSSFIDWYIEYFSINTEYCFSLLSGISHDMVLRDIFVPLCSGATLTIPDNELFHEPVRLVEWFNKQGITHAHLTPPMWELLALGLKEGETECLTHLKQICFGGDQLYCSVTMQAIKNAPNAAIYNCYGTTETPQIIAMGLVSSPKESVDRAFVSDDIKIDRSSGLKEISRCAIGQALPGNRLYLLDEQGEPVKPGEQGEIWVASPFLALGYYDKGVIDTSLYSGAEEIAEEVLSQNGIRYYRSGDIGKLLSDGSVELLGRLDSQLKIRGNRISLPEVERVITDLEAVERCVVIPLENDGLEISLAAFVLIRNGFDLVEFKERNSLRRELNHLVPAYMVPGEFYFVNQFPLNPNGKVDKSKLLQLVDDSRVSVDYLAGRHGVEKQLIECFLTLVTPGQFALDKSMMALGLNSLLAVKVLAKINKTFDVSLPYSVFMRLQSPLDCIALFEEYRNAPVTDFVEVDAHEEDSQLIKEGELLPLMPFQKGFVLSSQLYGKTSLFPQLLSLESEAPLDLALLKEAILLLIQRHPMLSATYVEDKGQFYQRFNEFKEAPVTVMNASEIVGPLENWLAAYSNSFLEKQQRLFHCVYIPDLAGRYLLLMVMDHSICDGWAKQLLADELNHIYSDLLNGQAHFLPITKHPKLVLRDILQDALRADKESSLNFWQQKLSAKLPILNFPSIKNRPSQFDYSVKTEFFKLPFAITEKLKNYSKQNSVTLFSVLAAAYVATLSRWCSQQDILVGVPVSQRSRLAAEDWVGCLVNTLPLRITWQRELNFSELVEMVQHDLLELFDHASVTPDEIMEHINPQRDVRYTPIYQTLFNFQDNSAFSRVSASLEGDKDSEKRLRRLNLPGLSAQTDISCYLVHSEEGTIDGQVEFYAAGYERDVIESFIQTYIAFLDNAVQADQCLREVSLFSDLQEYLPNEIYGQSMELAEVTLTQLVFKRISTKRENQVAIDSSEGSISYGECKRLVETVYRNLAHLPLESGQRVGVSVKPCVSLVPLLLGLMEKGICFVPLDPDYPKNRLDYIIHHAQLDFIIVDDAAKMIFQEDEAAEKSVRLLSIYDLLSEVETQIDPLDSLDNRDLSCAAYVMYTSGSTGQPKGVEVSQRALINFLLSMQQRPGMSDQDKLLSVTTLSFDISLLELFLPLVCGATLFIATAEEAMDGDALQRIIHCEEITVMQATPSTWRILAASQWQRTPSLPFKALCGGEALPLDVAQFLLQKGVELWNMYGPTEATVWATCSQIESINDIRLIGSPIHNLSVAVVDENHRVLPVGLPGELCIAGFGLANGYLNDEHQTQDKFVNLTLNKSETKRFYKTGDLVTLNGAGELFIHGRKDDQVKVRGHRIELQEIETALLQSELVDNVAVVVYRHSDEDVRLIAYYEASSGSPTQIFRSELKKRVPDYMIPQHYIRLAKLPLTPNGKIDKVLLKSQKPPQLEVEESLAVYLTPTEEYIVTVWKELLGGGMLHPSDTFFDVGGHSILALKFINQVKAEKGVSLIMNDLVFSNIMQLARQLDDSKPQSSLKVEKGLAGLWRKVFNKLSY